jgi:hypothetical protein
VPGRSGSEKGGQRSADVKKASGSEARFWVGIRVGRCAMYTGTLIKDLMATVERAEQGVQQTRLTEEMELHRLFELQSPQTQRERVFAGAA